MSKTEKIPVAVYQVDGSQFEEDDGFFEITNKIIKWAKQQGRDYNEEPKSDVEYPGFQIRIFGLCKTYLEAPVKLTTFRRFKLTRVRRFKLTTPGRSKLTT